MIRIGLLSDTHGYLDGTLRQHFASCDEIWHAGDVGTKDVLTTLHTWDAHIRAVYGNIDATDIRKDIPEDLIWHCEDMKVFMTHIAGYPGRYNRRVKALVLRERPDLVICGHSHILRIIYDHALGHLHINPGAAGIHGLHRLRTAVRFTIDSDEVRDMQVIELGLRGQRSG